MTRLQLTASSLRRVEICPASATLPRTERIHADAQAGTDAHAVLEQDDAANSEIAMAYAPETNESLLIGKISHRSYPDLPTGWIAGTADRVTVEAERVVIWDHKTGFGFNVEPARSIGPPSAKCGRDDAGTIPPRSYFGGGICMLLTACMKPSP